MRSDYAGFGILKDITKYRDMILKVLIKEGMGIEEKTLIRISVNSLNYKELVKKLKELGPCMKRASYKAKDKLNKKEV